jgi:rubredoxin-NAD+ reductase
LRAGLVPHVFDLATQPLGRLLPAEPAAHLRDNLQAAGVVWHLGDPVVAVQQQPTGLQLTTQSGQVVAVQAALSAVGLRAHTALAEAAGLAVSRGIVVDSALRTSDPAIFAVGDCAAYPSPSGPSPLPYVLPLMTAARTLAAVLSGESAQLVFPVMPVVVKTPSCPLVVAPPAMGSAGSWQSESLWTEMPGAEPLLRGTRSLFRAPDGQLTGFALSGDATAERQQWVKQLQTALTA